MSDAEYCRDPIERFLDRSWMLERTPLPVLSSHRIALYALDHWLQCHRVVSLTEASASDVRAMFDSRHWDAVSRQFEAMLGLVTRFYRNLQDCNFRPDDPIETLINQELNLAIKKRCAQPLIRDAKARRRFHFNRSPVV